jgi:hypothetical protein
VHGREGLAHLVMEVGGQFLALVLPHLDQAFGRLRISSSAILLW